jgi:hypothetical protein
MSKSTIRFFALTICTTALVMVAVDTAAGAKTRDKSAHAHVKKHHQAYRSHQHGFGNSGFGYREPYQAWPAARPSYPSGSVCPGIGRSFDCKIWPPPIEDDPDRKVSGSDGG